jgi:iron-sulfur cluster assembly protein
VNAIITISDRAAAQVKLLLEKRDKPSIGVKICVESGGCSGLKYKIEYADEVNQYDEVVTEKGVKVLIDPKATIYLIGSEMDFIEEEFKSGFVFTNPNSKGTCGCGESFHV